MALKSTIFKADLQVADLDRGYFAEHALTVARHPSETDERMMVRILAFARHASATLAFGRGLSTGDEADLWDMAPHGGIMRWIEVGLPDERTLRRACGRAERVEAIAYGGRAVEVWWRQLADKAATLKNLDVLALSAEEGKALAGLAERTMRLQCTIQEGHIWLGGEAGHVEIAPRVLQSAAMA